MKNALLAIVFALFGLFSLPAMTGNASACLQNEKQHSFKEWIDTAEAYEKAGNYDCAEEYFWQALTHVQKDNTHLTGDRNNDIDVLEQDFFKYVVSHSSDRLVCADEDSNSGGKPDGPSDETYVHTAVVLAGLAYARYLKIEEAPKRGKSSAKKDILANAYRTLRLSSNMARLAGNSVLLATIKQYMGVVDYAMGHPRKSQMDFSQALAYAPEPHDNNVNFLMAAISYAHLVNDKISREASFRQKNEDESDEAYKESRKDYEEKFAEARFELLEWIYSRVNTLGDSKVKVELLLALGKVLAEFDGKNKNSLQDKAEKVFLRAYEMVVSRSDQGLFGGPIEVATIISQATGHLAELYQVEGYYLNTKAIRWVDAAIFNAQRAHADYLLMRWETLRGDLLKASDNSDEALVAYGNAEKIWDRVSGKVPMRSHDEHSSMAHLPDAIYRGQVDIWLSKARASSLSKETKQLLLRQVIDTMEKIKRSELEEFSGDVCDVQGKDYVNLLDNARLDSPDNGQLPENKAVIFYPIVLPKRIEVLLVRRIDGKIKIEQTEPTPVDVKDVLSLADELDVTMRTKIARGDQRNELAEVYIEQYEKHADLASPFAGSVGFSASGSWCDERGRETVSKRPYKTKKEKDEERKREVEESENNKGKIIKALSQFYVWLLKGREGVIDIGSDKVMPILYLPDTPLRKVPFAALRNADGLSFPYYVIDKYDVVTLPLISMKRLANHGAGNKTLIAGLEAPGRSNMDALLKENLEKPSICYVKNDAHYRNMALDCMSKVYQLNQVCKEIHGIESLVGGDAPVLEKDGFSKGKFLDALASGAYSKVHIASHGILGRHMDDSHLLAYDGKISLRDLKDALDSDKLKSSPIELLSLSACETAKHNDYALLGFGSIATKGNVRSVVGTLYSVRDDASSTFSQDFYRNMKSNERPLTAFTLAMRGLIHGNHSGDQAGKEADRPEPHCSVQDNNSNDQSSKQKEDFSDPRYWAPFVFVGHW